MRTILLALVLLTGCAHRQGHWPAEVDPYVRLYSDLSRAANKYSDRVEEVYVDVVSGDLDGDPRIAGDCDMGENQVRLRQDTWRWLDHYEKQALVLHELGHCVHFMRHREGVDPKTGYPLSIMYPTLLWSIIYQAQYDYYNAELFGGFDN